MFTFKSGEVQKRASPSTPISNFRTRLDIELGTKIAPQNAQEPHTELFM